MDATRVLLCLTSLDLTQGGIAAVNRNVVRALPALDRAGRPLNARALVYHGKGPPLRLEYWQKPGRFQVEGCRSSRWRFAARFLYLCLAWRPALVFVGHVHLAVVPYLCRWLLPRGYVLFCHGAEFDERLSQLRRAAYRAARLRLGNSRFTAGRLMDLFPGVAVEVCELATDELAIPATTDGSGLSMPDAFGNPQPVGDQAVLIVGRLSAAERYKGHDQLIAILPAVAARVPGAQLMIAGAGDDRERLQALAREGGAGRSILFAGFTPPEVLAGLFARCRVFAMPSRGEGFGLVYLEAMGFARPCIASRADAGAEVVADGVTGLVVDPDDLDKLRTAVERLLVDDALAERMGRAGLERLNERFRFHHFQHRLQQRLAPVVPEFLPPDDRQAAMVPEGEVTA